MGLVDIFRHLPGGDKRGVLYAGTPSISGDIFENSGRRPVIHALRRAVQPVLERNFSGTGLSLLEIGCGSGFFYREMALDRLKSGILGIDTDAESLRRFQVLAPEAKTKRSNASRLEFRDKSFDGVVGYSMYPFFYGNLTSMQEVAKVLRPGGRFIVFNDSGMSTSTRANTMNGETPSQRRLEEVHSSLLQRAERYDLRIIEGEKMLEAVYKDILDKFRSRLPRENGRVGIPNDVFGAYLDRGEWGYISGAGSVQTIIGHFERQFDANGLLSRTAMGFRRGRDAIEYARLRYFVAEKT